MSGKHSSRRTFALALVAAGIATGITPGAVAATKTWVGTTASWNTAGNWNPSGVPGTTDDVAFSSGSAACSMDTSPRVASFTINGYTGTITPSAGTRLTVTGNFTQSSAATLVAPAWMSVGGTFSRTAGTFTQGTGTVFLTSSSNPSHRFVSTTFYKLSMNDGLVAHWRLDDATWIDSSGGGSTLTAGATPVLTTTTAPLTFSNAGAVDLGRGDSLYNTGFPQI